MFKSCFRDEKKNDLDEILIHNDLKNQIIKKSSLNDIPLLDDDEDSFSEIDNIDINEQLEFRLTEPKSNIDEIVLLYKSQVIESESLKNTLKLESKS